MQGAATAEVLLALGPPARDLSADAANRCSLTFATYLARLGAVFGRQGQSSLGAEIERTPVTILGRGYIPATALLPRLPWLKSRYLLAEDLAAADWLTALEERLRSELAMP